MHARRFLERLPYRRYSSAAQLKLKTNEHSTNAPEVCCCSLHGRRSFLKNKRLVKFTTGIGEYKKKTIGRNMLCPRRISNTITIRLKRFKQKKKKPMFLTRFKRKNPRF